jgi:hypothetical protein
MVAILPFQTVPLWTVDRLNEILVILITALLLGAAVYAQYRIPRHTAGAGKIALARGILLVTGLALGSVFAASYADDHVLALLAFLVGFGAVHIPAAVILFVKSEGGAGKS